MRLNSKLLVTGLFYLAAMMGSATAAESDKNAWPQHTPDGQPKVEGFWLTVVYGMGCLQNPRAGVGCLEEGEEPGRGASDKPRPKPPKAASRIVDTPDGEIPYQPWAKTKQQYLLSNYFEPTKPEFLDPQQLCLPLGPVRQLTWHDVHILQYPGYVIFEHEGGHVFRLIPLDGRPHAGPNIKLWMGDSRGHWEGNTLVVDVTNNNSKGRLSRAGDFASDKLHIVERFEFLDADHMKYAAKFDDPSVYTQPWTFGFDMKRAIFGESNPTKDDAHYEQWEEACYEGMQPVDYSLRSERGEEKK
jgi:hypothetical protein